MKETRALGVLKKIYPKAHWVTISGVVTGGVFDINACQDNIEVWVELKQHHRPKTSRGRVKPPVMPGQIAWQALRQQAGGKTFVALMLDYEFFLLPGWSIKELAIGVSVERLEELRLDEKSLFDATNT